jgi:hypothetical protein
MTGRQQILSPEQETGGGSGEGLFFEEGAMRRMTAYAVMAGFYLADAAPDTAGDVGAVHHDISPEACGIS